MRKLQSTNYQNLGELVVLCPISYTISQIGGRWKPLIIDRLLKQPMRYSELKRSMPSVTERVMTRQLKELGAGRTNHQKCIPGSATESDRVSA